MIEPVKTTIYYIISNYMFRPERPSSGWTQE